MSKKEARDLWNTGVLNDSGCGYVPAFSCPPYIEKHIDKLAKGKALGDLFHQLGVRCTDRLVLFDIDSTEGVIGPIRVRNGLKIEEYKIPEGSQVTVVKEYRL